MRIRGIVLGASLIAVAAAGCASRATPTESAAMSGSQDLSGCDGQASSVIPASHEYTLTSFGNSPSDNGEMSCGEYTDDGDWYYAASRQRYGCGSHVQVTANGKCVVVATDDYGPDVCVEKAAGMPILDASPLVAEALFGTDSAGWSDGFHVIVTEVSPSTPLGPCAAVAPAPPVAVDAGAPSTGGGTTPAPDAGAPSGGGTTPAPSADSGPAPIPCTGDGDCNPGDDGSGMICVSKVCVPGCHDDGQCPGDTSCVGGQCH
jgi:hypothetical protein